MGGGGGSYNEGVLWKGKGLGRRKDLGRLKERGMGVGGREQRVNIHSP